MRFQLAIQELNQAIDQMTADRAALDIKIKLATEALNNLIVIDADTNAALARDPEPVFVDPSPATAPDVILRLMNEDPGVWTAGRLDKSAADRGWLAGSKDRLGAIRGGLARLKRHGAIEPVSDVRGGYRLSSNSPYITMFDAMVDGPDDPIVIDDDEVDDVNGATLGRAKDAATLSTNRGDSGKAGYPRQPPGADVESPDRGRGSQDLSPESELTGV